MNETNPSHASARSSRGESFSPAEASELQTVQGGAWGEPTYGCEAQGGCGFADRFYHTSWVLFFGGEW